MILMPRTSYLGIITLGVLAVAVVSGSGCSATRARSEWIEKIVFWEEPDKDARYVKQTPAQRLEEMQAMVERIPKMQQAEQDALAEQLAQAYRNESDPLLRCQMVRTIAHCGSPRAAETLQAAASDSDRDVRIACCDGWAAHGGPQAVAKLSEALRKDASIDVRLAAARCMAKFPGQETIAALAPALEDPDPALQYRAVQSLRQISEKDFGDDAGAWREFARGGTPQEISLVQRMKLQAF